MPTSCNIAEHGVQTNATCCAQHVGTTYMLRSFARALSLHNDHKVCDLANAQVFIYIKLNSFITDFKSFCFYNCVGRTVNHTELNVSIKSVKSIKSIL